MGGQVCMGMIVCTWTWALVPGTGGEGAWDGGWAAGSLIGETAEEEEEGSGESGAH